jgi:hypothetical protein
MYYGWSKEFLEAGKRRLAGDTACAATSDQVKDLPLGAAGAERGGGRPHPRNRLLKKRMARPFARGLVESAERSVCFNVSGLGGCLPSTSAVPLITRRPRARSSAGIRRSRTASCLSTITCPAVSNAGRGLRGAIQPYPTPRESSQSHARRPLLRTSRDHPPRTRKDQTTNNRQPSLAASTACRIISTADDPEPPFWSQQYVSNHLTTDIDSIRSATALNLPLHVDFGLLAQRRRGLLRHPDQAPSPTRRLPIRRRPRGLHQPLPRQPQRHVETLPMVADPTRSSPGFRRGHPALDSIHSHVRRFKLQARIFFCSRSSV